MDSSPKKSELPKDRPKKPEEWKKWKQEKKALKRKRREEALIKEQEKFREKNKQEEEIKKQKVAEENLLEKEGRTYTVSIALPGSILDNAQSPELRTYLAGQIARAAVVFKVDEIVVFDETGSPEKTTTEGEFSGIGKHGHGNVQLARILQYLECPQYLRKFFFPQHKDLQYAGLLNPLDSPHHMKMDEEVRYREGVVLDKPVRDGQGSFNRLLNPLDSPHHMKMDEEVRYREGVVLDKPVRDGQGSFVNCGLLKDVRVDKHIKPGVRVTVRMDIPYTGKKNYQGTVVSPEDPRTRGGQYWGYTVRLAASLGQIFTECPYDQLYDLTIGTSERGSPVEEFSPSTFNHTLVVFGGVKGLEASLEADESLDVDDPKYLFQHYLNTCPDQGSGTIRTEEAILITMSALRSTLTKAGAQSSTETSPAEGKS